VQNNERAAAAVSTLPTARTLKNNKGGLTVASFMMILFLVRRIL
jgi:hypothetical protein